MIRCSDDEEDDGEDDIDDDSLLNKTIAPFYKGHRINQSLWLMIKFNWTDQFIKHFDIVFGNSNPSLQTNHSSSSSSNNGLIFNELFYLEATIKANLNIIKRLHQHNTLHLSSKKGVVFAMQPLMIINTIRSGDLKVLEWVLENLPFKLVLIPKGKVMTEDWIHTELKYTLKDLESWIMDALCYKPPTLLAAKATSSQHYIQQQHLHTNIETISTTMFKMLITRFKKILVLSLNEKKLFQQDSLYRQENFVNISFYQQSSVTNRPGKEWLECVQLLHQSGCLHTITVFHLASQFGVFELLPFIRETLEIPFHTGFTKDNLEMAVTHKGFLECILNTEGGTAFKGDIFLQDLYSSASEHGNIECIKYLHKHFPNDMITIKLDVALAKGHKEVIDFYFSQHHPTLQLFYIKSIHPDIISVDLLEQLFSKTKSELSDKCFATLYFFDQNIRDYIKKKSGTSPLFNFCRVLKKLASRGNLDGIRELLVDHPQSRTSVHIYPTAVSFDDIEYLIMKGQYQSVRLLFEMNAAQIRLPTSRYYSYNGIKYLIDTVVTWAKPSEHESSLKLIEYFVERVKMPELINDLHSMTNTEGKQFPRWNINKNCSALCSNKIIDIVIQSNRMDVFDYVMQSTSNYFPFKKCTHLGINSLITSNNIGLIKKIFDENIFDQPLNSYIMSFLVLASSKGNIDMFNLFFGMLQSPTFGQTVNKRKSKINQLDLRMLRNELLSASLSSAAKLGKIKLVSYLLDNYFYPIKGSDHESSNQELSTIEPSQLEFTIDFIIRERVSGSNKRKIANSFKTIKMLTENYIQVTKSKSSTTMQQHKHMSPSPLLLSAPKTKHFSNIIKNDHLDIFSYLVQVFYFQNHLPTWNRDEDDESHHHPFKPFPKIIINKMSDLEFQKLTQLVYEYGTLRIINYLNQITEMKKNSSTPICKFQ